MAKQTPDQSKLDPYKEVVIIHDTKSGGIHAVGSIDEKNNRHTQVDPVSYNAKAFMEVKKTSVIKNFITNLTKQAQDPYRFGVYIVPERQMPELVDNLRKLNENLKDPDVLKTVRPFRTLARQLDRIKFDKYEIPFEQICQTTGKPREEIEKNIVPVMEGKRFPTMMDVKLTTKDGLEINGEFAFRMKRDENGVASPSFYPPKVTPEFNEAKWTKDFSQEEKNMMASQKPLDRLIGFENPLTGHREYCFAKFDPLTNHLEPVRPRDVQMEEWAFRAKLDDVKMSELALGHKVFIEKGKIGPEQAEFSGKVQYDPYQERYVATDMKFQKPYIPQSIMDQLKDKPELLAKLESYEAIDGRSIKGRSGENYTTDIRVSRQSNSLEWGNFLGQNQSQKQGDDASQTKKQEAEGQTNWPDNDTFQSQGQGQGQKM